jgi:AcrR family transcriptional regulator
MSLEIKTKRARSKAERPAEILDATFEEFVKNGYAATRQEDVAARAGVTKGTIYFYFETKERFFEEMVRHTSLSFFPLRAPTPSMRMESSAATKSNSPLSRIGLVGSGPVRSSRLWSTAIG